MRRCFQIALIFGLVALGCAALVVGCRPGSTGSASSRIAAGWEQYRQGDFGLAVAEFAGVLSSAPTNSPQRLQALYGLATTWNLRRPGENPERAVQLYHEVIAAAPTSDLAAWSWLALARMKAARSPDKLPDLSEQLQSYQDVIDRFPLHPAGEQAFLYQQTARVTASRAPPTQAVLAALENFLKTHPQTPHRSAAYRLVAYCYEVLGLKDKLLEATLQEWKTAEVDPVNPGVDLSLTYWRIATIAEFEVGDFALAREYYRKFIEEYPTEYRVFLAKQELKRMDALEAKIRKEFDAKGERR